MQVDVFCFGLLLFEMLTAEVPHAYDPELEEMEYEEGKEDDVEMEEEEEEEEAVRGLEERQQEEDEEEKETESQTVEVQRGTRMRQNTQDDKSDAAAREAAEEMLLVREAGDRVAAISKHEHSAGLVAQQEEFETEEEEEEVVDSEDVAEAQAEERYQARLGTRPYSPRLQELDEQYMPLLSLFMSCTRCRPDARPSARELVTRLEAMVQDVG